MTLNRFLLSLRQKNPLFYYVGLALVAQFVFFLIAFILCEFSLSKICHWLKPSKFTISFAIYLFTLGWYMDYLKEVWSVKKIKVISWLIVFFVLLHMGIIYLQSLHAGNYLRFSGQTDQLYSRILYLTGNTAIITNTTIVSYVAAQFFRKLSLTPSSYLWAIRAGFIMFLLSGALGGYLIAQYGASLTDFSHFGIPFTRFATQSDNLISLHFLGVHLLQILPMAVYYFNVGKKFIISTTALYIVFSVLILTADKFIQPLLP